MTERHPAGYQVAEDHMTSADEEPNPLLRRPDPRLQPDPWLEDEIDRERHEDWWSE
jgi:hypothetical protein